MDASTFWSGLVGAGVPLGGLLIGWLTWKQSKKRDTRADTQADIDQRQEDIAALRAEVRQEKHDRLEGEQRMSSTINTQADYISALRQHIVDGKPPPPPPYPEGMRV